MKIDDHIDGREGVSGFPFMNVSHVLLKLSCMVKRCRMNARHNGVARRATGLSLKRQIDRTPEQDFCFVMSTELITRTKRVYSFFTYYSETNNTIGYVQ